MSSLYSNTDGFNNTASGFEALYQNTTGDYNTAVGVYALDSNVANNRSTAVGYKAMQNADNRTTGQNTYNTALGAYALFGSSTPANNTGRWNTASGDQALYSNTSGNYNAAYGVYALDKNTSGNYNTAMGDSAGYNNNGDGNVFIGHKAGATKTSVSNKLYIDNDDNTTPLIYGDFSNRRIGIGTSSLNARLQINSSSGEDPLRVQVNGNTKFWVQSNGGVSVGAATAASTNGLLVKGNVIPASNKGADLGTSTKAWNNIYYHNLINKGAAAFTDREVTKELLNYPPKPKPAGAFDEITEKGLKELDPNSVPSQLKEGYGLLTDEMTTYNYKANYEQQQQINELKEIVKTQNRKIEEQNKRIEQLIKLVSEKKINQR